MWLTDQYLRHPCRFILLGYAILAIATILLKLGQDGLNFNQEERDYLIFEDKKVKDWDKLRVAEDYFSSGLSGEDGAAAR